MTFYMRKLLYSFGMSPLKVVFIMGCPGAGKGTQCQNIVKDFDFVHLSAGDLLRAERTDPNSKYGDKIETYIREGKILPVDITCSLLEKAMLLQSGKSKFLIDGFPRNKDNLMGWNRRVASKVNLLFTLFFNCPFDICSDRCLSRGAAGSERSDDNIESLQKRFETYLHETKPIIDYYNDLNIVHEIDASKSVEEVYNAVKQLFIEIDARGE